MMEELEEHRIEWRKDAQQQQQHLDDAGLLENKTQEEQYAAMENALTIQHQESMSHISNLSTYELSIAQTNVIDPANLNVRFSDIGGMDQIKAEIYDLVVLPLVRPDLFMSDSGLVEPPKGILLVSIFSECDLLLYFEPLWCRYLMFMTLYNNQSMVRPVRTAVL
jgi:SpoVK/Ycf46/Vps4 family AAA+-type ATPase